MSNIKKDEIRLAHIYPQSLSNGPGLRRVYFSQGCRHHCEECFNPETWNFEGGKIFKIKDLIDELKEEYEYLDGISFSGGDPLEQADKFIYIAKAAKQLGLSIWSWTGYTWEELITKNDKNINDFLSNIDVLVDGKYDKTKPAQPGQLCGSTNQRIIDAKKTLDSNKIVLFKSK